MRAITIEPVSSSGLLSLVVKPRSDRADGPVLVFLHGMREAGTSPGHIPLVCLHQTPPWQAITGRLPDATVVAPQAPPVPSVDHWNWRDHVRAVAAFIREHFDSRRIVGTGFSRGGLGILQMLSLDPTLFDRWAVVDPQPPDDAQEMAALLSSPAIGRGWLRYGKYRDRSPAWTRFASALDETIPAANRDVTSLAHTELALHAYRGDFLSSTNKQTLYQFLGVRF